jgi:hypothetical protein
VFLVQGTPCVIRQHYSVAFPIPAFPGHTSDPKQGRASRLMAHPSGSGGTSLAPTPTHPHQLSRETSRDELEMAESLRLLNQTHDHQKPREEAVSQDQQQQQQQQPQPVHVQEDQRSEIYHSLEDAVPIADGPPTPSTTASLQIPNMNYEAPNAPITGQICRYVFLRFLQFSPVICYRRWE